MKARALVLMLLVGMMSFTGFGMTTPDLTENSTAVVSQVEAPVSVVVINAEFDYVIDASYNVVFKETTTLPDTAVNVFHTTNATNAEDDLAPLLQDGNTLTNLYNFKTAEKNFSNYYEPVITSGGRLSLFYIKGNKNFRKPDFT